MPQTRSNLQATQLPIGFSLPHPDKDDVTLNSRRKNGTISPLNLDLTDCHEYSYTFDTDADTPLMSEAAGLSIFSDFLRGRLSHKDIDLSIDNPDATLSGDSSFAYSWAGETEFEQAATKDVKLLYEKVQKCLYSETMDKKDQACIGINLVEECRVWRNYFPHLRVTGHQLVSPTDNSIQAIESSVSTAFSTATPPSTECHTPTPLSDLMLIGTKFPSSIESHTNLTSQEEIIVQNGVYEEIFAFDSQIESDKPVKKRSKLPPVSPISCMKEAIFETIFDHIWEDLLPLFTPLIEAYRKSAASATFITSSLANSRNNSGVRSHLTPNFVLPHISPILESRHKFDNMQPDDLNTYNINSNVNANTNTFTKLPNLPSLPTQIQYTDFITLGNMFQIRNYPLQSRGANTNSTLTTETRDTYATQSFISPPTTSSSSYSPPARTIPFQYQAPRPFNRPTDNSSQRPRTQGRKVQLKPLGGCASVDTARGPMPSESCNTGGHTIGGLVGYKLPLEKDRLQTSMTNSRSPIPSNKNSKYLPPMDTEKSSSISTRSNKQNKVSFASNRISSAGLDSAKQRSNQKQETNLDDTRPQTMHNLRTEESKINSREIASPSTGPVIHKNSFPVVSTTPALSNISLRGFHPRTSGTKPQPLGRLAINNRTLNSDLMSSGNYIEDRNHVSLIKNTMLGDKNRNNTAFKC